MKNPSIERVLDAWVEACRTRPGDLPPEVEPIQVRWIRAVGRGVLPDGGGAAFVKVMAFPRLRDRVRYVHRALPAVHEASMLHRVAALGLRAPRPLRVHGERRWGRIPWLSVLITAEVEAGAAPVSIDQAAEVAARLAAGGVFHPDLNVGNFLAPSGAEGVLPAILDLQSARYEGTAVAASRRRQMATKLVVEFSASSTDQALEASVASGLIEAGDVSRVARAAASVRVTDLRKRIRRCMRTSTEFVVERRLGRGRVHRRRAVHAGISGPESGWCPHPRAVELWLGDRAREVLDREPPILGALFRKSLWFPGESSVYIAGADGRTLSTAQADRLLEGFSRLQRLAIDDRG